MPGMPDEPPPMPARRVSKPALAAECAAMFAVGPLLYVLLAPGAGSLFPALWLWGVACLVLLLRDPGFDRRRLWNASGLKSEILPMLARFALLGGGITALVLIATPERAFSLPREKPALWMMIMLFYPLLSVYPQEVIFRAFFFRRYAPLFPRPWAMITASAVAFGYVHIVFENVIAVAMTAIGGIMFGYTYARSRSTFAASVEHTLYGCLVFTVGLGEYFYSGAVGR